MVSRTSNSAAGIREGQVRSLSSIEFFVCHAVVSPAEELKVFEGRESAMGPVGDVVGVTPAVRPSAAGMSTASIALDQGSADGWGDGAGGSADVEG